MPFFSVVIPLYNKERFVAATIQSVLSQSFSDFEIIVIDDCSTDGSLSKIPSDNRICIIRHPQNRGLSATRNTGIRAAASNYIAFIDSDDVWKSYFLEKMHEMIGKFPHAGLFAAAYEEVYPTLALGVNKNIAAAEGSMFLVDDFFTANAHQPIFCYSSVVVKREVFEAVGYFDEQITLGEDVDFNIRANFKFPLAYYNRICAGYTVFSENQITNSAIASKVVTDFEKYESWAHQKPSLKLYLDVNRYILAMHYKMAGDAQTHKKLASQINTHYLTTSQSILLSAPRMVVRALRKIKQLLLKSGIRVTTFRS